MIFTVGTMIYICYNKKNKTAYIPTNEDLVRELTEMIVLSRLFEVDSFIEKLENRRVSKERFIKVLLALVQKINNMDGAMLLHKCLARIGTRKDLHLLDAFEEGMYDWDNIRMVNADTFL